MTKQEVIQKILHNKSCSSPALAAKVFAPSNIAIVKYWGKRDPELNLPQTSSLSVTLPNKGSETSLLAIDAEADEVLINGEQLPLHHPFAKKASDYLALFRPYTQCYYRLESYSNIPIAAGLASSASGFAALVMALDKYHQWQLSKTELSILARLGSGSACRSLWNGFVEWQVGKQSDGMDSYGVPLSVTWPELKIGLAIVSHDKKPISSRAGMNRTTQTSPLYSAWPDKVKQDMVDVKKAIMEKNFSQFGKTAESNALCMHATMISAWPPVLYWQAETIEQMQKVWALREAGTEVYFTQDAGPNLKLLFLEKDQDKVQQVFAGIEVVSL